MLYEVITSILHSILCGGISQIMEISSIRALVSDDMGAVDALIINRLQSDVVLVNSIGHYIVNSGGKRLRPLLVLLAAGACSYAGPHHIGLAAVIEFRNNFV